MREEGFRWWGEEAERRCWGGGVREQRCWRIGERLGRSGEG